MYPVDDPQGVRDPRPDVSYQVSGLLADGVVLVVVAGYFNGAGIPVGGASSFLMQL
jgi:hypothetical protein